uniref:Mediator of RNA polymerase II transcription subunit 21 n=1 Tax=Kalanchoe fedtschenkoi TaxID=63787 RepID=A0A7N0UCH6_KALFE
MDIISQLQEQANTIAAMAFNTFGTLQRDAPPVRLSASYPEPPPSAAAAAVPAPPSDGAAGAPPASANGGEDTAAAIEEEAKARSAALVKAAKQFDVLVAALPLDEGGEEAQLKRIAELQAENDAVGQELQWQLEAAEKELKQIQELFGQAADSCLNLKKPDDYPR